MAQQFSVTGRSTTIVTEDGYTKVYYHNTAVVEWNAQEIILNTGGYRTYTTKTRMNQAANQFHLGYSVFQRDYEWYILWKGKEYPFESETMYIPRNGEWPSTHSAVVEDDE